ncbi:ATP-dependent Clp protease proteolytic subunit [Glycomyces albus]
MSEESKPPLFNERSRRELYEQRVLVLDGVLDDDNGTLIATQMLALAAHDPGSDIALWIHSPGGSVPSMLAIRDIMRVVPCDVATLSRHRMQRRPVPPVGRDPRQAARPAALPHPDAPGLGRDRRRGRRHRTPGRRPALHPRHRPRAHRRGHRPAARAGFRGLLHDRWYTADEAIEYGFVDAIVSAFDEVAPHARRRLGFPAEGAAR